MIFFFLSGKRIFKSALKKIVIDEFLYLNKSSLKDNFLFSFWQKNNINYVEKKVLNIVKVR